MKKIIILGAGIYQVPLIKAAKKLGLYVIVVSIPGDYPGFALADRVYELNTTDKEAVLEMARKEQVSAIVTTGTDVAVSTIGYVCDNMGLAGISFEAAKIVTDKALMKEAFYRGNVTTAPFEVIHSYEDAVAAFDKIKAPAMLKIVDKSGSRGITRVDTIEKLAEAYEYAKDATAADHMILEKFIEGKEIGIDAFVQNGEIKLIVPHDKLVFQTGRTGIPMGHICPMDIASDTLRLRMEQEIIKVIRSIGLDNCAVNTDVFITPQDEVYVIEAAGRCGATGIPEVLSGYFGIDYYEMILKNALGEPVDIIAENTADLNERADWCTGRPTASVLIHSDISGKLKSVEYDFDEKHYTNQDSAVSESGYVKLDFEPGTQIYAFENGTHRIGQAVIMADTQLEVLDKVQKFRECVTVTVE